MAWTGRANVLDRHPMYHWPAIEEVSEATRIPAGRRVYEPGAPGSPLPVSRVRMRAATLIRRRRSAQHFDKTQSLPLSTFYELLDALLPRPAPPWDLWRYAPKLHPVLLVHRVAGLAPGAYVLARDPAAADSLRAAMNPAFTWRRPTGCPGELPLFQLVEGDCAAAARTLHCHQAIATDACFALGMVAEYESLIHEEPWRYRQLHWEAGLLGQALYLEAEARELRGTGIGCFFDDDFHALLGLTDRRYQSLYHFTVGYPITDSRIITDPPYADRC